MLTAMMTATLDAVMARRAQRQVAQVRAWMPAEGRVLDLGSGTGHAAARLAREPGLEVVAADVSDMHVVGPPPVLVADGVLPFAADTFSAALLCFVLAYPADPASVLAEVARVTRGPIIVVQSLHANRVGYAWLRAREFVWTMVGFHVSRVVGFVPRTTAFRMHPRRFYTDAALRRDLAAARLRIRARRERPVLPGLSMRRGRSLVVAEWSLERDGDA